MSTSTHVPQSPQPSQPQPEQPDPFSRRDPADPRGVKAALLERAAGLAREARTPVGGRVEELLRSYYRHVPGDDLSGRTAADAYGALASHLRLAHRRRAGETLVRVVTPSSGEHGWSADGHSVVEVVTDDMPFLVDSVTMELARQQRDVHLVAHPHLDVARDEDGVITSIRPDESSGVTGEIMLGAVRESWMHVEVDRLPADDPAEADALVADLRRVLGDVRAAVDDWGPMHERVREVVAGLRDDPPPLPRYERDEAAALLEWLADEHFTFLGYREYRLEEGTGDHEGPQLRQVPGSGLGILRTDDAGPDGEGRVSEAFARLPLEVRAQARERTLLVLAKANARATVHRPVYLDHVGVKTFDADGNVTGERRFLGLFSSAAYTESITRIPLLREKVAAVLRRSGFDRQGHAGKALLDTLETYPRDDLFHTPVDELAPLAEAAMQARQRRSLRMFLRSDSYGRYVSVLVYLPRDRYNTAVRERFSSILTDRLSAAAVDFNVRLDESPTARVHFVVRLADGGLPDVDTVDLERRLAEASRSWSDDLVGELLAEHGEERGAGMGRRWAGAFPEAYKEDFAASTGATDAGRLEELLGRVADDGAAEATALSLYEPVDAVEGEARLKVYRVGAPLSLSQVLPTLTSMGVEVVDERPYGLSGLGRPAHVYDFGLRRSGPLPDRARSLFTDAVRAVWDGRAETDGFNALVLAGSLTWREVSVLRAYAKYMRQGSSPFALDSIEEALVAEVTITRLLVDLFATRFDPDRYADDESGRAERTEAEQGLAGQVEEALEDVASLDHDRILRSYLAHLQATLRTSFYRDDRVGGDQGGAPAVREHVSFKLDPRAVPDLPDPRPRFEIFVHSPRVEGVHLRFGSVARGGLRWSDRRDDFRTEVLGLVKAQMVKNTVIVPVGAKGGFYAKQLPDPAEDREAWTAEGKAAYTTFIRGLLDVTDNLVDGETVAPPRVVRHDEDDSYLVVAADKGTATFSDLANAVAGEYDFWLGDAFASGGSVGYDHKAMGITARGAWVSVQRHFREMGVDCQTEDFTCVGVGDMSGDVFGNGMLLSEHTRLVAAFDHRDVFVDPDPDAATSYAERRRLFELPRSSWRDYDTSLISEGGGVFPRTAKSVEITPQVREALGLDDDVRRLTPTELVRAILLAPVDLLWNGGIGTYVKAASESHADAGDKANDAVRVDGRELRARSVGEGGNLGLTQRGRIEYARRGGRVNTDFIDNSAGVDTSDHEVNLKILLDRVVAAGDLTRKQRDELLASMTDEVAELVLADNDDQNLALANALAHAPALLHVHEGWMKKLEHLGVLDRRLEGLPDSREVKRRLDKGDGLTAPELSVLLSWTKILLAERLLDSDLPEDPYLDLDLRAYFPQAVREGFAEQVHAHPLRREIIVTQVVNDLVNGAGMTYWPRLAAETGASPAELTRANFVAREIFGSRPLREQVRGHDHAVAADVQTRMRVEMRTLVERASRWLLTHRRTPLDSQGLVDSLRGPVQDVLAVLPDLLTGRERAAYDGRREALLESEVPEELASLVAVLPTAYQLLHVAGVADELGVPPVDVARVHLAVAERLGLDVLLQRVLALPRDDQWQTMARATLRDELHDVHARITAEVLRPAAEGDGSSVAEAGPLLDAWEERAGDVLTRSADTLREVCADEGADLARLSVGLRAVRGLVELP